MDPLRTLVFVAGGLFAGYLGGRMLGAGRVRLSSVLRTGLIVAGGALGVYLSHAAAAPGQADPIAGGTPVPVLATARQFDEVAGEASTPVLVDFYADWCGPCRQLAPVMERLHTTWGAKVAFYKVNVDASPALARRFRIEALPTLVLVRDGREVRRILGAPPRDQLERLLAHATDGSAY